MKSLHILSIVTWLPTLGAIIILALFKKDQERHQEVCHRLVWPRFRRLAALLTYDRAIGGMQFLEDHQWIPVIGARYQMGVDGVAVLLIVLTTLLGVIAALVFLELHRKAREGILRSAAPVADGGGRRVYFDGPVSVLPVLRSLAGADVFPDRNLGRREPFVRGNQVFSLHAGGIGGHAARRFEDVLPNAGHSADQSDYAGNDRPAGRKQRSGGDGFEHAAGRGAKRHRHIQYSLHAGDGIGDADGRRCRCCCSSHLRSALRSRCRCFRFTPGFPTLTSKRRQPVQ